MSDAGKSKDELAAEVAALRQRVDQLEAAAESKRELRESEKRYRALFEHTNDSVAIISLDQYLLDVNQQTVRMFGYDSVEDMVGRPTSDFISSEGMSDHYLKHQTLMDGQSLPVYERMLIRKDGTILPAEINLTMAYDEDGNPSHVQSVIRNITERKRVEEALRESERKLRGLIENSTDAIRLIDENGLVVMWNPASEELYGLSSEQAIGKSVWDIEKSLGFADYRQQGIEALKTGIIPDEWKLNEFTIQRTDGSTRHIQAKAFMISTERGYWGASIHRDFTERKQDEATLRESQDALIQAQRIARVGNWVNDLEKDELYWSDELFRILGRERQTIFLGGALDWVHPDDQERLSQAISGYTRDKSQLLDIEYRCVTPEGNVRFLHSRGEVVCDEAGKVIKTVGTVQDITDRKQMEDALRKNEERYRIITELMSDFAFACQVEPDGSWYTEWSTEASFVRLTGYASKEVNNSVRLYHPEDGKLAQQHIQQTIQGQATDSEYRIFTKSGEPRWLHLRREEIWDEDENRVVRFYGIAQDITERKRVESALRGSEERYRALFESVPVGISVSILGGEVFVINAAMRRMLGYSREELDQHESNESYQNPEDRDELIARLKRDGLVRDFEVMMQHKDDRPFYASLTIVPFPSVHEDAVMTMMMDITERKQIEQQRLALALERERIQLVTNFITQASHEFRTPLSTINTSIYLLGRVVDPEDQKRHLDNVERQVKNITVLVNMLTLMARLDGSQDVALQPVNANQIVRAICETRQSDFKEKNLAVVCVLSEGRLLVNGHAEYLNQAVGQLIDNAIRYTPDGGTITIRSGQVADVVMIEVADTGAGIGEGVLPNIFERFYRGDIAGTTRGFGLGLPIAKAIIDHHHGQIEVETKEGQGSVFRILLPTLEHKR
jgi:PAS domain S-box-containing protein